MPQTTPANEEKTYNILREANYSEEQLDENMDGCALRYLARMGWKETRGGSLIPPANNKDEDQWEVATYLVQEWDYGIGTTES